MREQQQIRSAFQLNLPAIVEQKHPVMHIEMDGTGVSGVKKETVGHQGKIAGQPSHTREVKLGCGRLRHSRPKFDHLCGRD